MTNNWPQTSLADISDNLDNQRVPISRLKRSTGRIPYYGATGVVDYVDEYIFDEELLLVGEDGADWSAGANTAYIIKGRSWVNNHAHVLRIKNADIQFIENYLNFTDLRLHTSGTTRGKLNKSDLMNIKIPNPSISVQQKIAEILSSIDDAIQKTDQIIQKTEILKQGLMQKLLTRGIGHKKFKNTKFGEIPKDWELTPIGEICDCIVPGRNKPKVFDGEIPWITIPNIQDSIVQYNDSTKYVSREELRNCGNKIIPIGSVIMSCVGEFGIVAVTDREIAINQQLHAFLPSNELDQNFLKFVLIMQKRFMENLATKTSVSYLNKTSCNSIPIVKPPIKEQLRIAGILSSLEQKITKETLNKGEMITFKNGLMQDIFSQKVEIKS